MHTMRRSGNHFFAGISLLIWVLLSGANSIGRADGSQEVLGQVLEAFTMRQQIPTLLPDLDAKVAIEIQDLLLMNLAPDYGVVAGYLFETTAGDWTVLAPLLENMFTSSGATLYEAKGSEQSVNLGWLLRVRGGAGGVVSGAPSTRGFFSELIPAVFVHDQLLREEQRNHWAAMTAVNAGTRYLVLGTPWPIPERGDPEILNGPLKAVLVNGTGEILTEGVRSSGDQERLESLSQLQHLLAARGRTLRAGDLVSLGSVGPAVVTGGIGRVTARFSTVLGDSAIVFAIRPPISD